VDKETLLQVQAEIDILRTELNRVCEQVGSRKEKALATFKLEWNNELETAFRSLQNKISQAVSLAILDPEKVICVFTDSSLRFWSLFVTQIPYEDLHKDFHDQNHEPIAIMQNNWSDTELKHHISELEAAPCVYAFERLDYLFYASKHAIRVYIDHKNIRYIFQPPKLLAKHVLGRLHRWGIKLAGFNYIIADIPGERNVFADLLSA